MTQSTEVAARQQATAAQYNALRRDVLDSAVGHRHTGVAGDGALLPVAAIPNLPAARITSGIFDNARINWASPGAIGTTTQPDGSFAQILGGLNVVPLATPTAPTVTIIGTAGTTRYDYRITARSYTGETLASAITSITTGNAILSATNFNRIAWPAVSGARDYRVWRVHSAGTPTTLGVIATVVGTTIDDTGLAGGGQAIPVFDTSGSVNLGGANLTNTGDIDRVRTRPGILRVNLSDPTVEEAALIDAQFTNRFAFFTPTLQEESTNGITWTTSTRLTSAQLANLMIGRGNLGGGTIMTFPTAGAANWYRLTWDLPVGMHWVLNAVYMYMNSQGNDINVRIEAFHNVTGWADLAPHGIFNGWPSHGWFKHDGIIVHSSKWRRFRLTFWTTASQNTNHIDLMSLEWWGGFPAAPRDIERYDSARNAHFPAGMTMQGNVGVGTAAPGTLLTLRSAAAGNVLAIRNIGDTADTFRITDTGIVNLGTWQGTPIAPAFVSFDFPRGLNPTTLTGTPRTRYVLPGWYFQAMGTITVPRNLVYYTPIFVAETTVFDRIGIEVITGGGTGCIVELRVFSWIGSGIPGSQIAGFASVSAAAVGVQELWVDFTLTRGYYFLAALPRLGTANPALRCIAATSPVTTPVAGLGPIAAGAAPVVPGAASNIIYVHEWPGGVIPTTAQPPWQMRPINYAFVFVREHD